jgi:hypothetical protein
MHPPGSWPRLAPLLGFLAMLLVLGLGEPWRGPDLRTLFPDKQALLRERSAGIDCVFLGSSLYYRHIDPSLVDAGWRSERAGSSFNLGIPALTLVEQEAVLASPELRALPRLKVVVLEPILSASLELRNLATSRVIEAHGPSATWSLCRHLAASDLATRRRLWYGGLHLAGLGLHLVRIPGLETLGAPQPEPYLPPAGAGFLAAGEGTAGEAADPNLRLLRPEVFDAAVATRDPFRETGPELPASHLEMVLRQAARVRDLGARPVLLVTPRLDWDVRDGRPFLERASMHALRRSLREAAPDLALLAYDDDPEFLRAELWHDTHHMNREGARRFSERLGRDLEQLVRSR